MLTLNQLQDKIHKIYQGDSSTPTAGSEDYIIRTNYINDAIHDWAYHQGVYWRQLFTTLSSSSTGDKTASSSTTTYNAPTDLVAFSSWLKITDNNGVSYYYYYKKNDDVMKAVRINPAEKFFYLTGKPGSYVININSPVNGTINYPYYKRATELSSSSDVIEMSKPYFAIYKAVAQLYELDNRNDMVLKYTQLAKNIMDEMIIENETAPFNTSYTLDDLDYQLYGATFGK